MHCGSFMYIVCAGSCMSNCVFRQCYCARGYHMYGDEIDFKRTMSRWSLCKQREDRLPLSRCRTNFHDRRHHGQHTKFFNDQSLSMAKVWHSKFMVEYGTKARRAWWKSCRRISFSFSFLHCIALRPDKILQSEAWRVHRVDFSSCLMFVISVLSAIMYRFFRRDALGASETPWTPC